MSRGRFGWAVLAAILATAGSTAHAAQYGTAQSNAQGNAGTPAVAGGAGVTLVPQSITFPAIPAGSISPTQTITVTNTGTGPLHVTNVQVALGTPPGFASISSCALPVAPGESCSVGVSFYPSTVGSRTAQLLITDDAPGSPQTVSLIATAIVPYSISASGATTATIAAGGTAQFSVQLVPVGEFLGSVGVQCTGAPRGASCAVTPSTVALSTRNPGDATVDVKVATMGAGAAEATPPGTYTITVAANWGLLSEKATFSLTVQ